MSKPSKSDTPLKKTTSTSNQHTSNTFTLADVMRKLNSIDEKLNSHESKLSIISNSLSGMQESINYLRDENVILKEEINNMRSKITTIETNTILSNNLSADEVIFEAQNRIIKSNNVIIFNLSELPNESSDGSLSIAREMISDLALNLNIIHAKRIGKTRVNGRPLLIEFNNSLSATSLLKSKTKLRSFDRWKNVWVNADLTRNQQIHMKELRDILRRKREEGDSNSVIKYVRGVPSICSKN